MVGNQSLIGPIETCVERWWSMSTDAATRTKVQAPHKLRDLEKTEQAPIVDDGVRLDNDQHSFDIVASVSFVDVGYNRHSNMTHTTLCGIFDCHHSIETRLSRELSAKPSSCRSEHCITTGIWIGCCLRGFQALVRRAYFRTGDLSVRCFGIGPVILFLSY